MILKVGKKEKENQAAPEEAVLEQETAEAAETEEAAPEEQKPSELEELQKANADLSDKLLRQMAEFDNFRKRTAREKEEIGVVAKSKCIAELLPVLDNFERAMMTECADAEFKKGMEMIFKSMNDALKKLGVEEIEAEGQPFDPDFHYAVSTVENEELGSNVVASVLQKGYQLNGKVIRHAMVAVANP
ncbi:MAG TPA: nucleotide exchange factor GrpE [Candidatus Merdivicinus intestinigallinarum]|nr:nucleotide exchange factor GrpE [Candidatus Merdivicinus intestinigallinarum]